jgi:PAS domain S-box-containing protein
MSDDRSVPERPKATGDSVYGQSLGGQSLGGQSLGGQSLGGQSLGGQSLDAQGLSADGAGSFDDLTAAIMATTVARVGYWRLLTPSDKIICCETTYDIHGLSSDLPVSAASMLERFLPEDRHLMGQMVTAGLNQIGPAFAEFRLNHPTLGIRHLWSRVEREQSSKSAHPALFGITIDITDLRQKDQDLVESERHLRFLTTYSRDMIIRFRADGTCTYISPAVATITGYDAKEMVGHRPTRRIHPDDFKIALGAVRAMVAKGKNSDPIPIEYRYLHKTKGWIWLQSNMRFLFGPSGEIIDWIDIVRDIHDRKIAEQEAEAAKAIAQAAARSKSEFLSTLSHELRTPLTGIIGLSQVIGADGGLNAQDRHYLDLVQDASRQLMTIVNNVLDISRLEFGTVRLVEESFRLSDTLANVIAIMTPEARAKGLALRVELPGTIPLTVGDPGRISQILFNLVSNATKHSSGGEISLKLVIKTQQDLAKVRISVTDTGTGLNPVLLPRLFDRVTAADAPVQAKTGGAGLGLSISRQLIELMGGTIGAENIAGGGAQFWFELDLPLDASEPLATVLPRAVPTQRMSILLAEDNEFSQELIKTILKPLDCEIETVENGQSAIYAAQRKSFDLILMDIRMPGMDGHASTRAIRAMGGAHASVPIIALSAAEEPQDIEVCLAAGMNDHVAKPILPSALYGAIARHSRT